MQMVQEIVHNSKIIYLCKKSQIGIGGLIGCMLQKFRYRFKDHFYFLGAKIPFYKMYSQN